MFESPHLFLVALTWSKLLNLNCEQQHDWLICFPAEMKQTIGSLGGICVLQWLKNSLSVWQKSVNTRCLLFKYKIRTEVSCVGVSSFVELTLHPRNTSRESTITLFHLVLFRQCRVSTPYRNWVNRTIRRGRFERHSCVKHPKKERGLKRERWMSSRGSVCVCWVSWGFQHRGGGQLLGLLLVAETCFHDCPFSLLDC